MTRPIIPTLSDAPNRDMSQTPFTEAADSLLGALPEFGDKQNELSEWMNTTSQEIADNALIAQESASSAIAGSNFKGRWADAVGPATVPSSYEDEGKTWALLQDIPNIAMDKPSSTAVNWQQVTYRDIYDSGQTYSKNERVVDETNKLHYISCVDNNKGNPPSTDDGSFWERDRPPVDWVKGRSYEEQEMCYSIINRRLYTSQVDNNLDVEPSTDDGTKWLSEYGKVVTPTVVYPTESQTQVPTRPTLEGSVYQILGSDSPQEWAVWQVATDALFTDIVYDSGIVVFGNHMVSSSLPSETTLYVRVAYKGVRTDVSEFSPGVSFVTSLSLDKLFSIDQDIGNGVALDVYSGVDLLSNSGVVWTKDRGNTDYVRQFSTQVGLAGLLMLDDAVPIAPGDELLSYNADGISLGSSTEINTLGDVISSYTFRDSSQFHQTILYEGSSGTKNVPHNMGNDVGFMILRQYEQGVANPYGQHFLKHKDLPSVSAVVDMRGISNYVTGAIFYDGYVQMTSGSNYTNINDLDYIAEIFRHNPTGGVFCGKYTGSSLTQKIVTGFPVGLFLTFSTTGGIGERGTIIADIETGLGSHILMDSSNSREVPGSVQSFDVDGVTLGGNGLNHSGVTYYFMAIADPKQF